MLVVQLPLLRPCRIHLLLLQLYRSGISHIVMLRGMASLSVLSLKAVSCSIAYGQLLIS